MTHERHSMAHGHGNGVQTAIWLLRASNMGMSNFLFFGNSNDPMLYLPYHLGTAEEMLDGHPIVWAWHENDEDLLDHMRKWNERNSVFKVTPVVHVFALEQVKRQ